MPSLRAKAVIVKSIVVAVFALSFAFTLFCLVFGQHQRSAAEGQRAAAAQYEKAQQPLGVEQHNAPLKQEEAHNKQTYADKFFEPTIILAAITAFLTLVIAAIYWDQLRQMRKTVALVAGQGSTMQEQLKAMKEQANLMRYSLEETRKTVSQNERAVAASEEQAVAAQASAKAAERSIELTQKAYIESARAHVGIKEITISKLSSGQIPTLHVTWYNGGQTPASRFRAVPYLVFGDEPKRKGYILQDDWSDSTANFLPTGMPQTIAYPQVEVGFKPVTDEMLAQLENGSKRLYAMVSAVYFDFAGERRSIKASYIYDFYEGFFTELW